MSTTDHPATDGLVGDDIEVVSPYTDEEADERARRLLHQRRVQLMEMERAMRKRIQLHARYLTDDDREAFGRYLRHHRELTVAMLEDISSEAPDFAFPSEMNW